MLGGEKIFGHFKSTFWHPMAPSSVKKIYFKYITSKSKENIFSGRKRRKKASDIILYDYLMEKELRFRSLISHSKAQNFKILGNNPEILPAPSKFHLGTKEIRTILGQFVGFTPSLPRLKAESVVSYSTRTHE